MNEETIDRLKAIRATAWNIERDIEKWLKGDHDAMGWCSGDTDAERLDELKRHINHMHAMTLQSIRLESS